MEMDCNLKKLGQFFQVLMLCSQKSPKKLLWLALPNKIFDIFLVVLQEHFVYDLRH